MRTISNYIQIRAAVIIVATIMLMVSGSIYAQAPAKAKPVMPMLADITPQPPPEGKTSGVTKATFDQVLANPIVTVRGGQVTEFTISYLPNDKDFFGPFKTKGASLTAKQLEYLRELKEDNITTRIFIEDIHADINGQDIKIKNPVLITCSR